MEKVWEKTGGKYSRKPNLSRLHLVGLGNAADEGGSDEKAHRCLVSNGHRVNNILRHDAAAQKVESRRWIRCVEQYMSEDSL
jgi:hypothetical protein